MGIVGYEPTQYKLMPIMGKSFESHDIGQKNKVISTAILSSIWNAIIGLAILGFSSVALGLGNATIGLSYNSWPFSLVSSQ